MKTIPDPYENRTWVVAEIPQLHHDSLSEQEISVRYTGEGNCLMAEPLDRFIIPLFKLAPKLLKFAVSHGPATWSMYFSDEDAETLRRLADCPRYALATEHIPGEFETWWGPVDYLALALAVRHVTSNDVLLKLSSSGTKVLARSNGIDWIPEPPEEDGNTTQGT